MKIVGSTLDDILEIAVHEYLLDHPIEDAAERRGRHAAVRGMMGRMEIYNEFCDALEAARIERIGEQNARST